MIVELLPEVQKLSPEDKPALAAELFEEAADWSSEAPDAELLSVLNERLAEYRANPEAASPWSEVKARILRRRES
jgi:putative addiction module component (TIGR02574 family)